MAKRVDIAGYKVLLDDEDCEWAQGMRWTSQRLHNGIYFRRYVKERAGIKYESLHRAIAIKKGLDIVNLCVDHKNRDTLDNRRCNIRAATYAQNNMNKSAVHGAIPYKGVYRVASATNNPYRARIKIDGKYCSLGYYATPEKAARAYDSAAIKYYGEFACTNAVIGAYNNA